MNLSKHSLEPQKSLENTGVSKGFPETHMFNSATHKRPERRPRTRKSEDALDRNLKSKALKRPCYIQYNQGPLPGTARHDKEVNAGFFSQQLIS